MDKELQKRRVQDALKVYLGLTDVDLQDEVDTQDWNEHATNVARNEEMTYHEHVNKIEEDSIDLDNTSLGGKVKLLADDTLNQLLTGEIKVENAQELIAVIQAIDMAIDVSAKGKDTRV